MNVVPADWEIVEFPMLVAPLIMGILPDVKPVDVVTVPAPPPPEPHVPNFHLKNGDEEDSTKHMPSFVGVEVDRPVPPPEPWVTGEALAVTI